LRGEERRTANLFPLWGKKKKSLAGHLINLCQARRKRKPERSSSACYEGKKRKLASDQIGNPEKEKEERTGREGSCTRKQTGEWSQKVCNVKKKKGLSKKAVLMSLKGGENKKGKGS